MAAQLCTLRIRFRCPWTALKKIKNEEEIEEPERESISKFADLFFSCSLKNPRVENIVKNVNIHHHTKTCRKYSSTSCRFNFPRFPSLRTLVSVPLRMLNLIAEQKKVVMNDNDKLLSKHNDNTF